MSGDTWEILAYACEYSPQMLMLCKYFTNRLCLIFKIFRIIIESTAIIWGVLIANKMADLSQLFNSLYNLPILRLGYAKKTQVWYITISILLET